MKNELSREDIKDILLYSGSHALKDRGDNIQCCCPVHGESTPSMGYSMTKKVAHCFSCHFSGSIEWLLFRSTDEFDNLTQVRDWIKERYDVNLHKEVASNIKRYEQLDEDDSNEEDGKQHTLPKFHLAPYKSGKETFTYFLSRGFNTDDVKQFMIGRDIISETVTIPVFNLDKTLCGIIGRYIDDNRPKNARYKVYEFPKGKVTYPIDKLVIKNDTLILVEGILDALWLHKHGYTNAQAILGNSLSKIQTKLLKDNFEFTKVILAFDNDKGGDVAINIAKKALGDDYTYQQVTYPEGIKDVQELDAIELEQLFNNLSKKRKVIRRL